MEATNNENKFEYGWLKEDADAVTAAFEKIPYQNRQEIKDKLLTVIKKCYDAQDWPEHKQYPYPDCGGSWFLWEIREILIWASD
jgi:hypothetical protein